MWQVALESSNQSFFQEASVKQMAHLTSTKPGL